MGAVVRELWEGSVLAAEPFPFGRSISGAYSQPRHAPPGSGLRGAVRSVAEPASRLQQRIPLSIGRNDARTRARALTAVISTNCLQSLSSRRSCIGRSALVEGLTSRRWNSAGITGAPTSPNPAR